VMLSGRLFQSLGPAEASDRSMTVTRRDGKRAHQCTVRATQCNCNFLNFLSPELWSPTAQSWTTLITRLMESYSSTSRSWVNKTDEIKQRLVNSKAVYSIWVKKMRFVFPCFPGSAEALVRCSGKIKHISIAYFLVNISVKNYQNRFTFLKVMARKSMTFLRQRAW